MGSRIRQNPETTFEVYVEVTSPGTRGPLSGPEVQRQFPEDYSDQEVLQTLTKFCFPFCVDSLTVSQVGQNFTFVLTDIDSKQRFGFCRLSSGAKSCFCILSYLPWFEVFYKLLNILADYTAKGQESQRNELLETLYKLPIPDPGMSVHLSVHSYFTVPDTRELPSIPENRNLTEYFVAVDVNNMLHLYASMLYERRILISSSKLSTLTACIHGSAAMLYPMFWQHVYIPVLPPHLLDYCCAPMPYLIGIHLSLMEKVRTMALEDVVILNVDTNTLETPFDDLQSLPNDVVSSLKNRLKKVSTTTGDGVARAFLKAQAAFFGSYRNALKIEPEEPITFSEETFVSHRSSAMRQFLQNAIQLQLFKQFIDGRLDLLNSGEGFSDVFEEEINMGEYAGSDKLYHQWLSTVRKGSGAILNTVKTKANPAMKTVYKFAKDHAKLGIKEVKNRLKQKDIAENGCSPATEDPLPKAAPSPLAETKDSKVREDRRPITVHFGQVRPPRPQVVKRPKSNVTMESRRTSVSSPDQPLPYRVLRESDSADGEETGSPEKRAKEALGPPPPPPDRIADISLLEDIFSSLEVEQLPQPLSQAKSLEDLRPPKDQGDQPCTFDYQRMDLCSSERSRIMPGLKLTHPYNQLWSMGQDDMAIPTKHSQPSPERPLASLGSTPSLPRRPRSRDSILTHGEKEETPTPTQGNITIPRPQGRKTPELGIVPPPPTARPAKLQPFITTEPGKTPGLGPSDTTSELIPEAFGNSALSRDLESRPPLSYLPPPPRLLPTPSSATDILKPVRVVTDPAGCESDYLLTLLDPLKTSWPDRAPPGSVVPNTSGFPCGVGDFTPASTPFVPKLGFPSASATTPFLQPSLNPFAQHVPTALPVSMTQCVGGPFAPSPASLGQAFTPSFMASSPGFYTPQRPQPSLSALSMPNLFGQVPPGPHVSSCPPPGHGTTQSGPSQPSHLGGPSKIRTLPLVRSSSRPAEAKQGLILRPGDPPVVPPRPFNSLEPVLQSSGPKETRDPFEDLLQKTKQEIAPTQGKVEQLRKRWETFE
ncbi:DENN domain-containing protein 1A-like isoform X3 [Vombatus ursinus]|uniref:UDENN domain-containing protein n=1 Tax=Vombatus ursinus TaxID=29139 RepID=A0A4X2KS90_VOMUR|nr:DENN domain-containing protein 1A-like isoform X3 [Vombatus ursinus]XP_027723476.1 DENN domain-containing protein 1A-like isoform X3 [Vombatus ursinus]